MTPVAHTGIALWGWQAAASKKNIKTLFFFLLISSLPDIDFLFFPHQYYTHNLVFVFLTALAFFPFLKEKKERLVFMSVSFSHLLLDLVVIDGVAPIGIPLLFPFSREFFNLGFFPNLQRGPLPELFTFHNLVTLVLENLVFLVPVLFFYRKEFKKHLHDKEFLRP